MFFDMEFTAKKIAKLLNGEIIGDKTVTVNTLAKIEEAQKHSLSFLANPKYEKYIYKTAASIVIVSKKFEPTHKLACTLIKVEDPYIAFAKLLDYYAELQKPKKGISEFSYIAETAQIGKDSYVGNFTHIGEDVCIGKNVKIYPQVYIGDKVQIKDNSSLFPGVKIYNNCVIGNNCTIHAGSIIGADGFGFAPQQEEQGYKKIAQIGNVIIEDNVEIGANVCIDKATLGSTIIKKGVKIDNLIQIGHNVVVHENTVMAAQTGISGSTVVGKNCMFGGQVGIAGHLNIGENVKIGAQSGISGSIKDNKVVLGSPAIEVINYRKSFIHFKHLDSLNKRVDELERKLKEVNEREKTDDK
jgi:UDP-3-O-[3-hydroxymyristoyl] glucosamine N-acyltransferase